MGLLHARDARLRIGRPTSEARIGGVEQGVRGRKGGGVRAVELLAASSSCADLAVELLATAGEPLGRPHPRSTPDVATPIHGAG
jgi:hypothetical protein